MTQTIARYKKRSSPTNRSDLQWPYPPKIQERYRNIYARAAAVGHVPMMLKSYRIANNKKMTEMVDLLQKRGVPSVNWSTCYRWEHKQQKPHEINRLAIIRALERG